MKKKKVKNIKFKVSDEINISESVSAKTESHYLLISNREKIQNLLSSELSQDELIEVFISIHIVLEVGINSLFRYVIIPTLKKRIKEKEMVFNLDKVNFIDKVVMFIYYSKFDFSDLDKATEYHSVINKLRKFSEMRNSILHGHEISTRFINGRNEKSKLKSKLNLNKLQDQINDFRFILDGMRFYVDSLNMYLTDSGKETYKKEFLDTSFLPNLSLSEE